MYLDGLLAMVYILCAFALLWLVLRLYTDCIQRRRQRVGSDDLTPPAAAAAVPTTWA
jgi:hypothetical protein